MIDPKVAISPEVEQVININRVGLEIPKNGSTEAVVEIDHRTGPDPVTPRKLSVDTGAGTTDMRIKEVDMDTKVAGKMKEKGTEIEIIDAGMMKAEIATVTISVEEEMTLPVRRDDTTVMVTGASAINGTVETL